MWLNPLSMRVSGRSSSRFRVRGLLHKTSWWVVGGLWPRHKTQNELPNFGCSFLLGLLRQSRYKCISPYEESKKIKSNVRSNTVDFSSSEGKTSLMFERLEIEGEKRFWEIAPPQFGFHAGSAWVDFLAPGVGAVGPDRVGLVCSAAAYPPAP